MLPCNVIQLDPVQWNCTYHLEIFHFYFYFSCWSEIFQYYKIIAWSKMYRCDNWHTQHPVVGPVGPYLSLFSHHHINNPPALQTSPTPCLAWCHKVILHPPPSTPPPSLPPSNPRNSPSCNNKAFLISIFAKLSWCLVLPIFRRLCKS